jgi:hypothetical protein
MIRVLALALVITALVGFAPVAQAAGPYTATFLDLGDHGVLTLTGTPGTQFVVRAEQMDGSYATVWAGSIGLLPVTNTVAEPGPVGNGQPQFVIYFSSPGGGHDVLTIDDPADRWYLE